MQYFSTNQQANPVSFKQAAITGQAPDRGLYFPEHIPQISTWQQKPLTSYSKEELGFEVMRPYVGIDMPEEVLYEIVSQTINFAFPVVHLTEGIYTLELFHGPTLAFKDVGARFMSRCLGYFNRQNNRLVTVLVATSGDTGGAVAHGFEGVEGVEVIILYPEGKVSPVQELQLTTCGANIHALKIAGSFDDCQAMVKQAFTDADYTQKYQLTSANSINVARWLPQQLYYFFALQQWPHQAPPVICVPSGNFGNICAGMIAHQSGLPVQHFLAACNANDVIPQYLADGVMRQQQAVATLSNAMDVALPSNFVRIWQMAGQQLSTLRAMLSSSSVSDAQTLQTMQQVHNTLGYILDPHGAVGYHALQQYLQQHPQQKGIFLETAHPIKFPDAVEQATGRLLALPPGVAQLYQRTARCTPLPARYAALKEWLLSR